MRPAGGDGPQSCLPEEDESFEIGQDEGGGLKDWQRRRLVELLELSILVYIND